MNKQPWNQDLIQRQAELKKNNRWRQRKEVTTAQQPLLQFAGAVQSDSGQPNKVISFSSNDYLGLANHPNLVAAMRDAASQWGVGSGASHLVSGHQTPHHQLEQQLAEFVGAERALLFSTGYMANMSVPATFLDKHDLLLQDKLNHASLIDAARLSHASLKRYAHADLSHLRSILARAELGESSKVMIATDGVFSMDGDVAPLFDLKQVADQCNGILLVDDAHGLGVVGETGHGSLQVHGLQPVDNVLLVGTLGKGFGSFGAFVAGDQLLIEQLIQTARPYIYTTALPAAVAAATQSALSLIQGDEGQQRRYQLNQLIERFRDGITQLGLAVGSQQAPDSPRALMPQPNSWLSPIQPIVVGDELSALNLSDYLLQHGFYVTAIRPPTVPVGSARLRFTLSAAHNAQQVDALLDCLDSPTVKALCHAG